MIDGYVPVYRDYQGWPHPVILDIEDVVIYKTEAAAEEALAKKKEFIRSRLQFGRGSLKVTPRKFWFDKIEIKHEPLTDDEKNTYNTILKSAFVRKVRIL